MSAEQSKSLMEQRAELEKQLQSLTDKGDALYTPGMTMISGGPDRSTSRQPFRSKSCRLPSRKSMKPSRAALSYGETLNGGGLSVATHFISGASPDRVRHLMGEILRRPESDRQSSRAGS
jgi:hypothetical protein